MKKIFIYLLVALFIAGCNEKNHTNSAHENMNLSHNHQSGEDHDQMHETDSEHKQESGEEHNHTLEPNETHEHETEEIKVFLTTYSKDLEIFCEIDPLVVGKKSEIISFISVLSDFSPLKAKAVSISLVINENKISQKAYNPFRKGIYTFDIKPETAGSGKIVFDIETEKGNKRVTTSNVTVYEHESEAYEYAELALPLQANTTIFTKEQSWKIDFATELPALMPFGQIIKTTAQVRSAQNDEIILTAKTSGVVLFSGNTVLAGKEIAVGRELFTITGKSFADNNSAVRFIEAKNNFEKAKMDYERAKSLSAEKIVSEKELLNARIKYENTEIVYNNLNENFNVSGQVVKSPINGFIKYLYVQNGQHVDAGQALAVIAQNKNLLLHAEVQQKYASVLNQLKTAIFSDSFNHKTYSLDELNGRIVSWGKSANNDNYLIPVHIQFENNGDFYPGSFIPVFLKMVTNQEALTVPNSSLLEEQGLYYVYVQCNPELFEKREIVKGTTDGLTTEILDGLSETERVVTKGAVFIKLSRSTGTLDTHSGHVH